MEQQIREKSISLSALDKLISAHDGDVALLYLCALREGTPDPEKAAHDLCRTMQEVLSAREKLQRMGLLEPAPGSEPTGDEPPVPEPAPPEELPQVSAAEIAQQAEGDRLFSMLLEEAVKVMGRSLNSNELRVLFGIYNQLGLPAEVIMELLHYCEELCGERYGDKRRPTARFLEKEAFAWAKRELFTLEQAEEYIAAQKRRRSASGHLKELFGIGGRDLTPAEQEAFPRWLDMGFEEQALLLAYSRTLSNTGAFKLSYMNKILENWHSKGLHRVEEIEARDQRRPSPAARGQEPPTAIDMDQLRKLAEQI